MSQGLPLISNTNPNPSPSKLSRRRRISLSNPVLTKINFRAKVPNNFNSRLRNAHASRVVLGVSSNPSSSRPLRTQWPLPFSKRNLVRRVTYPLRLRSNSP
jgi:hypothetical protein